MPGSPIARCDLTATVRSTSLRPRRSMPGQQPRERHDALECLEQFHRNRRNAPPGRRQLTLGASEFIMKRLPTSLRGSCASTMSLLSLAVPTACDIEEQCHKPSTRITTDFNRGGRVAKQELMSECGWEPSNEQSAGTCLFHPTPMSRSGSTHRSPGSPSRGSHAVTRPLPLTCGMRLSGRCRCASEATDLTYGLRFARRELLVPPRRVPPCSEAWCVVRYS